MQSPILLELEQLIFIHSNEIPIYRSWTKTGASFALDSEITVVGMAVWIEKLQKLKLWVNQTNSCHEEDCNSLAPAQQGQH